MKKWLLSSVCLLTSATIFANTISPIGSWRTIDDVTLKPKAIVEVSLNENKQLQGRISKTFPEPGTEPLTTCASCPGNKKNQPIIGLVFMEGLVQSKGAPAEWENGTILDPKTGKIYRCRVEVDAVNNKMKVRGFIGLPLLGRTQTWERV